MAAQPPAEAQPPVEAQLDDVEAQRDMTRSPSRASSPSGVAVSPASSVNERLPIPQVALAPSDASLVAAIASGAREALAELYDRYAPSLLALAQRILHSASDAEDLLHDFFLEVWQQAHTFDPSRGSVRAWLVMRLRCRAFDRLKSASYTRTISLSTSGINVETLQSPGDGAAEVAPTGVQRVLSLLGPQEQILLELTYFQGHTLPEVADYLSLPLGTVKSRLRRLLDRLRRNFDKSSRRGPP